MKQNGWVRRFRNSITPSRTWQSHAQGTGLPAIRSVGEILGMFREREENTAPVPEAAFPLALFSASCCTTEFVREQTRSAWTFPKCEYDWRCRHAAERSSGHRTRNRSAERGFRLGNNPASTQA